tara:strand:+ start:1206 stop:3455 length:2250 start_codon:yes stop_codon:yes gene_type:complete
MAQANFFDDIPDKTSTAPAVGFFDDIPDKVVVDNEVEAEIASGNWTSEDSLAGALIFIEGATLGWSDEIGAGLASLAFAATTDETQEEAYARLKANYDAMQEGFAERQPIAATGLEFAGALVSPVAKLGAAKSLTGLIGRAATEGAIYGAGKAETGADAGELALEAAMGGAFGGAGGAVFGMPAWLLKRKIASPLDTPEGFKPLTLAADKDKSSEAILQSFYRDVIGPSFGGAGIIRAQEEKIVAPLVAQQKVKEEAVKQFKKKVKQEDAEAAHALNDAIEDVGLKLSVKQDDVKDAARVSSEVLKGNYSSLLDKTTGKVIARQTAQLKNNLDSNTDMFRLQAFDKALPASIKKADVADILESPNPNAAMQKLEDQWSKVGFESIKTRSYQVDPNVIAKQMASRLKGDTTVRLMLESSGQLENTITNIVSMLAEKTTKGRISGKDLAALRSSFGTAAASKSDVGGASAIQQYVLRDMQSVLDNVVTRTLSGDRLAKFEADKAAWATHSILKDAVKTASTKTGRQGRFNPDEWLQAAGRNSPRQSRQGKAPLQAEANSVASTIAKQEETIKSSALKLSDKIEARRIREINRVQNKAKMKIASLKKETSQLKKDLARNPENVERLAANQLELENVQKIAQDSADELQNIEKLRTPENPSWFHRFAATGFIGGLTGLQAAATGGSGLGASVGGAIGTVGAAKGLAGEGVQRFLAGQTPFQQAAQQAKFMGSEALGTAPLAGARAVTGMLTGQ